MASGRCCEFQYHSSFSLSTGQRFGGCCGCWHPWRAPKAVASIAEHQDRSNVMTKGILTRRSRYRETRYRMVCVTPTNTKIAAGANGRRPERAGHQGSIWPCYRGVYLAGRQIDKQ